MYEPNNLQDLGYKNYLMQKGAQPECRPGGFMLETTKATPGGIQLLGPEEKTRRQSPWKICVIYKTVAIRMALEAH